MIRIGRLFHPDRNLPRASQALAGHPVQAGTQTEAHPHEADGQQAPAGGKTVAVGPRPGMVSG